MYFSISSFWCPHAHSFSLPKSCSHLCIKSESGLCLVISLSSPLIVSFCLPVSHSPHHTECVTGHSIQSLGTLLGTQISVPGWFPFFPQDSMNYSLRGFNKVLETFFRDFHPMLTWWPKLTSHSSLTYLNHAHTCHVSQQNSTGYWIISKISQ